MSIIILCSAETKTNDRVIRHDEILVPTNQSNTDEHTDMFTKFFDGSIAFVNTLIDNPDTNFEQSSDFEYINDEEYLNCGITSIFSKLKLKQQEPTLVGNHLMRETHLHTFYNGNKTPSMSSNEPDKNVLLLGLGFPNSLRKQWLDVESPFKEAYVLKKPQIIMKVPAMNKFQYYDNTRKCYKQINANQMTDFVRGIIIEEMFHPCQVYSVNGCTDEVRNNEINGERELNVDLNTSAYIDALLENEWKIDMVFLDHFRMYSGYISSSFGKGFFEGLKKVGRTEDIETRGQNKFRKGRNMSPFYATFFRTCTWNETKSKFQY